MSKIIQTSEKGWFKRLAEPYQDKRSVTLQDDAEVGVNGFRADLIVGGEVILELKSVEKISPVHKKQLLTYLKLTFNSS